MDLLREDTRKLFFKYLSPSISATLVTSIYVIADTIMIGKGVGASGIAALNLILPLFTLLFGTGLLLGVVAYSIVANCAIVAMSLFNGVSQGAQPIIATNYGAHQIERVVQVRRLGEITAIVIGVIIFLLGAVYPDVAVTLFVNPTPEILDLARGAIRIYFIAFLMMDINMFYSTYFQSILKPGLSLTICLLRGLIICVILVFILPLWLGVTGIWLVMPITEFITIIITMVLLKCEKHKQEN